MVSNAENQKNNQEVVSKLNEINLYFNFIYNFA